MDKLRLKISNIFQDHNRKIFGYLYSSTGNADLAHDLTQDTFLNFMKSFENRPLPVNNVCVAYLFRTARNLLINHSRNFKKESPTDQSNLEVVASDRPEPHDSVIQSLETERRVNILNKIMLSLNEKQRTILLLRYEQDLTLQEISEILNLTISSVDRLLTKARKEALAAGRVMGI
jgi:RNA polymerase sigma-70 factor (ECF subfamily)